jgi:hypothetical protein
MRAPDKIGRDLNQIIADIVNIDGVGRAREPLVRLLADGLGVLKPYTPLGGWRKDNTEFAEKLRAWVNEGEQILAAPPEGFNPHTLFVPELQSLDETIEQTAARYSQAQACSELFTAILALLRQRCDRMIDRQDGEHRSAGYQAERAALAAEGLMEACGLPLAYASPTSPYCRVASLFYEAATGEYGRNLERACEAMARGARKV